MLVKWDPADAVSVPSDCEYEKLRVCKYTVVSEVVRERRQDDEVLGALIYSADGKSAVEVGDSPEDLVQRHSDQWYKARNYIESCRDDGHETIPNRDLDDLFDISNWDTEEWEALKDETDTYGAEWVLHL